MGKHLPLANNFTVYKDEIELIQAQNRVECDLYSIIANIIRISKQGGNISLRDVSVRRTTDFSRSFKGDVGFPDFVIRTREKSENAAILGAVEIKYIGLNLEDYIEQLNGHIDFYKQVIYTNGIEWRFYHLDQLGNKKLIWEVSLGESNGEAIIWNDEEKWWDLLVKIDNITWAKQK
ncbi:hypothetical protein Cpap_0469 [Ruminiclostridium papyrosolvens DSM 2782]|uniref:Type I restriction enzyme R protein N-terminal domain-containing protein n=1 Tax=Ruminiclostridium papyrosolvens DSM 2782 TaxID=588581 RepID=F1THH2_9FIRM|nr:hypothetical protein [Ruminiclostridium papyrosolvens]EGD46175.1 hypothetical protein Cpap_0469 [Ruminiclostridium papyrosolvens DSM 2782]WES35955.1 hypothetical protein P0092_08325 [Ruminiclostridium papyrosolvens DSM 2782]